MKKALMLTWQGYQDNEVLYPMYRLHEDNFEVDILAESKGFIHGILGTKVNATFESKDLTNDHVNEYDFLVIPGGVKALEKLRQQQNVIDFITAYNAAGKTIACICHGAQMLISAKVLPGRKASGYYSIKDDIENAGATYVDAPAVVDNNLICCPHYDHMGMWLKEALDVYTKKRYA
tara:strand:+ start:11 stop:541 length:531 start_codon:yes stop_codon:yes gene_type:complete